MRALADKSYEFRATITYLDGTKKRKAFYAPTITQAKAKAKAAQDAAGGLLESKALTLGQCLEMWLSSKRRSGRNRPRTIDGYESHVRRKIGPSLGQLALADLRSWHIQSWLNNEIDSGLGIPTVRSLQRTLSSALAQAKKQRLVVENEAGSCFLDLPSHRATPAQHFELDEVEACLRVLLERASSARYPFERAEATLLFVALTTGMRNAEVIGLTWSDVVVDPDGSGRIHVCRTLQRVVDRDASVRVHTNGRSIQPRKMVAGPPKSKSGDRWIALYPEAVALLRSERARQSEAGWQSLPVGDLVFRTRYGKPLSDVYLGQRVRRLCDLAGLERRSFYALRHTFASLLVHAGESDVSLADAIGHSDASTTKKVYAHMFDAHRRPRMESVRALTAGAFVSDLTAVQVVPEPEGSEGDQSDK